VLFLGLLFLCVDLSIVFVTALGITNHGSGF
jgi:hypothetical protein